MELPDWCGRTVVCIATGPSLTREQVDVVDAARSDRALRVIAINDAGLPDREPFTVPSCDVWYAPDNRFWSHYRDRLAGRSAIRVGAEHRSAKLGLVHSVIPRAVGGHAGIQALQLALDLGADLVLLLGYDCRARGEDTNYFGVKPPELRYSRPESYPSWVPRYRQLNVPAGQRVLNCTPGSEIDAFEFAVIDDALARRAVA